MEKRMIEVLKATFHEDSVREYVRPGLGKCLLHKAAGIFYGEYEKPEDFCDKAWKAIYQHVFALAHGSGLFYSGDWTDKQGITICSRNDGLRPVIFRITPAPAFVRRVTPRLFRYYLAAGRESA